VLLHTLALDRTIWDPLIALLPEFDVLAYDARGHGVSAKTPGPYTAEQFADDLADLLAAVGWERAIVLGASMGGSVAMQFAVMYPAVVEALGLVDTTAWYGVDAPTTWAARAAKAATDGFASMVPFQETRWFSDAFRAAHPEIVARTSSIFLRSDLAAYTALCDMLGRFDGRSALTGLTMPVEILVGEEDDATPVDMSQELERLIPGSYLTIVPNVRHLTIIEIPASSAALVRTLVARTMGQVVAHQR
jgi:3-oxoadipate enol-lactonase